MKKLILTMCLTAAGVFGAAAQMRLTLGEALDLALSENPTVKVAEMEVQRYDYVKRQTWGNLLPQLSASGSYTRSIVKSEMRGGLGHRHACGVAGDKILVSAHFGTISSMWRKPGVSSAIFNRPAAHPLAQISVASAKLSPARRAASPISRRSDRIAA